MQSIQNPLAPWLVSAWPVIYITSSIILIILAIYSLALFANLAHLGMKALKIYIAKNQDKPEE